MKTFKDLKFIPSKFGSRGAKLFFNNGYGISVIYGRYTFTNPGTYEVAILVGDENNWDLTYSTPITDDVIGHCSESEVTEIMQKIQELKNEN